MENAENGEVHEDQYGDEMYEEEFSMDEGKAEDRGISELATNELQNNPTESEEGVPPEQQLFDTSGEAQIASQDYQKEETETGGAAVHEEIDEAQPNTTEAPYNSAEDVDKTGHVEGDISSSHEDEVQAPLAGGVGGSPSRDDTVLESSSLVGDKPSELMEHADADQPDLEEKSELAFMSGVDRGQFDPEDALREQSPNYHPADEQDAIEIYHSEQVPGSPEIPTPPPMFIEHEDTLPVKDDTSPSILVLPYFYCLH
jgi:hypothetical protein